MVPPGEYEFRVGRSAADIREAGAFDVVGRPRPVPSDRRRFFVETHVGE